MDKCDNLKYFGISVCFIGYAVVVRSLAVRRRADDPGGRQRAGVRGADPRHHGTLGRRKDVVAACARRHAGEATGTY